MNILAMLAAASLLQTPVIVVEHNYGGVRTAEGALIQVDYQGGSVLLEFAADGIFRDGFGGDDESR